MRKLPVSCQGITKRHLPCKRRLLLSTGAPPFCKVHLFQSPNLPLVQAQNLLDDNIADPIEPVLAECPCCLCECFESDLLSCSNSHSVCKDCFLHWVTEKIVGGNSKIDCMRDEKCEGTYPEIAFSSYLPPKIQQSYKEKQFNEMMLSMENIFRCPKCNLYGAVIEPDDLEALKKAKIPKFECFNANCKHVSCLLCKGDYHFPQQPDCALANPRMDGVRKFVEETLYSSRVRHCPKCKVEFLRTAGCNKMTCPTPECRMQVCYLCSVQIEGYTHFGPEVEIRPRWPLDPVLCPVYTDESVIALIAIHKTCFEIYHAFKNDIPKLSDAFKFLRQLEGKNPAHLSIIKRLDATRLQSESLDGEVRIDIIPEALFAKAFPSRWSRFQRWFCCGV